MRQRIKGEEAVYNGWHRLARLTVNYLSSAATLSAKYSRNGHCGSRLVVGVVNLPPAEYGTVQLSEVCRLSATSSRRELLDQFLCALRLSAPEQTGTCFNLPTESMDGPLLD